MRRSRGLSSERLPILVRWIFVVEFTSQLSTSKPFDSELHCSHDVNLTKAARPFDSDNSHSSAISPDSEISMLSMLPRLRQERIQLREPVVFG